MSQAGIATDTNVAPVAPIIFDADLGSATAALGVVNIIGGAGISTSAVGNTITISQTGSGVTWGVVTSANNPVNLASSTGYIAKGAGVVNFVLPAVAVLGAIIYIEGYGNLWTLAQNAGQSIILGNVTTTVGIGGSLAATMVSDAVTLLCVTANTEFKVITSQGNLIIV